MFPCMDTAIRPTGNRSGALTPSRTVGGLSSHMDPGYDEGDWELDIRRTQEDANTEVSQDSSLWFQQFLGATSSACHVGLSVECVDSPCADTAVVFTWADQSIFLSLI